MSKKQNSQHVVKDDDGWAVKKGGSMRATRHFDTQQEAIEWARNVAKRQKAEFYIHGKDGRIRSKDSYGNDANPPKDKR
jgi:type IV secretory pathway TrbL component